MKFASTEFYINLISGITMTLLAARLARGDEDEKTLCFLAAALASVYAWQAFRSYRTPNVVEIIGDHLTVYEKGAVKHYIDLKDILSVSNKFSNTVLHLQNGLSFTISSRYFVKREDVAAFRQYLQKMINSAKV